MEGVGDEVLLFGLATVVGGVMLYYAALHMFSLVSPPGSEGATTVSQVLCASCIMQCAVCIMQCAVYIIQCAVCTIQCAVCSVQCAVCSVQCAVSTCSVPGSVCTRCRGNLRL